jgi:hypothetical protein
VASLLVPLPQLALAALPARRRCETALFDYIEVFYNQRRRHSMLTLICPAAFERQAAAA